MVMPNQVHGIIQIVAEDVGAIQTSLRLAIAPAEAFFPRELPLRPLFP